MVLADSYKLKSTTALIEITWSKTKESFVVNLINGATFVCSFCLLYCQDRTAEWLIQATTGIVIHIH